MFNVTLVNLSPDARTADAALGALKRENVPPSEVIALLEAFRGLDPLQYDADPEIRVVALHGSFFIRTERGKLFFYDARNRAEPACELSIPEIMAELDGSAMLARTAVPFDLYPAAEGRLAGQGSALQMPLPPARRRSPVVQAVLFPLLLVAVLALRYGPGWLAAEPALERIAPADVDTVRRALTGVYLTGSEAGQHGIVVLESGDIRFFQLNEQVAPSVIYDVYTPGRRGAALFLQTSQPGGLIEVGGPLTLLYGGEIYQRIP